MIQFRETTLANGLRIAAEIYPQAYTAAFGFFVRAGARDEDDKESGLSHFLEHMVFKGTPQRTAAEVNRELDDLGGQSNAYTTEEQTVFYATVLPKYQHRLLDVLTDIMRPSLRSDDFETERLVILEEIAKYEDQPPFGAFERSMEARFGAQGLGRRVLGTVDSIQAMTPEAMRSYFQRRYQPGNIVLAAAGNVDFDQLVQQVDQATRDWPCQPVAPDLLFPAPAEAVGAKEASDDAPTLQAAQAYAIRIAAAPAMKDLDRYGMRLLGTIFGDESGSRLFWELVDTGRAELAATWTQEFIDTGALFTYLACAPEDLAFNLELIDRAARRIVEEGVEQEELDQAINKTTAASIMQSERPSNRLFTIGNHWLLHQDYVPLDALLERYRSVTRDDLHRLLQTYDLRPLAEVQTAG
jgi:predicted Zn-dependent peptidase